MLKDIFKDDVNNHILGINDYNPYPKCTNREKWDNIEQVYKDIYLKNAEKYIDFKYEAITASIYLYTGKTDDLTMFSEVYAKKVKALYTIVIAECIENNGKYMEKIFDGVWSLLDEATWHFPCPSAMYKRFPAVMVDVTDPLIELASSQYAYNISLIYYLLKEKFDKLDINIYDRIYYEINRRIFEPYLNRKDYWWMAYERHYHKKMGVLYSINNFTPHCTNNVLDAFLYLEKDNVKRSLAVSKTMEILDNYINFVADDGWCDEGNGYWFMAYGALNCVLEKIKVATNDYVNVYDNKKVYNMGQYLCNAHIGNGYFVNFSDSHPVNKLLNGKVIKFALNTNNSSLLKLAFEVAKSEDFINAFSKQIFGFETALFVMFNYDNITNKYGVTLDDKDYIINEHYYRDSEVLIVRENNMSYKGIYLACKGGHNDENHNHNDVGNFIVYKDSIPIIVDPGVESYIADTFNENRYKLWTMQSKYHNLPTFNGVMQKETRKYRARKVKYINDTNKPGMLMSLKDAYESESGLIKYDRTIIFNRDKSEVRCNDSIKLSEMSNNIEFSFMTPCETKVNGSFIEFYNKKEKIAQMEFDDNMFLYDEQIIKFRCEKLKGVWNNYLKRIILKVKKPLCNLDTSFIIK